LATAADTSILEHAAAEGLVVLTHDANTMSFHADERLRGGLPLPGLVVVPQSLGVGRAVAELEIVMGAGTTADFENQVLWVPL
jgi:hypothetical protein